jgi:hypothetical protein
VQGTRFGRGNRSFIDPSQSRASFGGFAGFTGGDLGFNGAGGFGTARQGTNGLNQFGSFNLGGHQGSPASLFPPSSGPFGATPQLPLNQLMRGSFNLPLNSPASSAFRFQYSSTLMPGGNLNDLARPYGSVVFTTSDLGNGVFLSAGTSNGSHSMAGAPAASFGNDTSAPKHSASGVAIKLSF